MPRNAQITIMWLLIVMSVSIFSNLVVFHYGLSKPRVESDKLGSIVRLVHEGRTFCSGTIVNETTIITAAHCVLMQTPLGSFINDEPIEIRVNDNLPLGVFAKPYAARVQLDQALIYGDFHAFAPRKILTDIGKLNKYADKGTYMKACGYPLGGDLYCSTLYFDELYDFMWSVNGLLLPGMSGGPVMLRDGTVVAVNVAVEKDKTIISPIYNIDTAFRSPAGK
jgi:V8-like Glu-specific endopeptidase